MKKFLAALLAAAAALTMSGCINKDAILAGMEETTTEPQVTTEGTTAPEEDEPIPQELLGQWYMDIDAMTDYAVETGMVSSSQASQYRAKLAAMRPSVTLGEDGSYTSVSVDPDNGGAKIVMNSFTVSGDTFTTYEGFEVENVCTYKLEDGKLIFDSEDGNHLILTRIEPVYETEEEVPEELFGSWSLDVNATVEYNVSSGVVDEENQEDLRESLESYSMTAEFFNDGTYRTNYVYTDGDINTYYGVFSIEGGKLVLDNSDECDYEVTADTLIMESDGVTLVFARELADDTSGGLTARDIAGTWEIDRAMSLSLTSEDGAESINLFADCALTFEFTADGNMTQITDENGTVFTKNGTFTIELDEYSSENIIKMQGESGSGNSYKIYFVGDQLALENDSFTVVLDKVSAGATEPEGGDVDVSELIGTWEIDVERSLELSEERDTDTLAVELFAQMSYSLSFDEDGNAVEHFADQEGSTYRYTVTDGVLRLLDPNTGDESGAMNIQIDGDTLIMRNDQSSMVMNRK